MYEDEKGKTNNERHEAQAAKPGNTHEDRKLQDGGSNERVPKFDLFQEIICELKRHVYGAAWSSQFKENTERVGEVAKKNCTTLPLDVWTTIDNLSEPDKNSWRPSALDDPDDVADAAMVREEA